MNGVSRSHGVTLVELLVVIAIIGVVAVAATPFLSSNNPEKLELAANEFADAIRFARSEAVRTGQLYGIHQQTNKNRIRVFRPVNTTDDPWVLDFDVYHPVTRQLYDIDLDEHPLARASETSATRVYREDDCDFKRWVYFDASGVPRCADPGRALLLQFDLTFTLGSHTRVVKLHPITGRVTVE